MKKEEGSDRKIDYTVFSTIKVVRFPANADTRIITCDQIILRGVEY